MKKQRNRTANLRQNASDYLRQLRHEEFLRTHIQVPCDYCYRECPFVDCPRCHGREHVWLTLDGELAAEGERK